MDVDDGPADRGRARRAAEEIDASRQAAEGSRRARRRKMAASTIVVLLFAVGTVAGYHWYENRDIATMTVSAWCPGYPQFGLGGYVAYEGHYYGVQDPPWSHSVRGTITLVHVPEPVPGQPYTPSDHPSARFTHDGKTISLSNSMHSCPIS